MLRGEIRTISAAERGATKREMCFARESGVLEEQPDYLCALAKRNRSIFILRQHWARGDVCPFAARQCRTHNGGADPRGRIRLEER